MTEKNNIKDTDAKESITQSPPQSSESNQAAQPIDSSINTDSGANEDSKASTDSKANTDSKEGRMRTITRGANDLSLGISMIVAVLLGFGFGYGLYTIFGYYWLIWVGLGYGVAAAILNVVKAYKRLHKELDSLRHEKKYQYMEERQNSIKESYKERQDRILEQREREAATSHKEA